VYIATPAACQQQLQQLRSRTSFVAAFTAPGLQQQVEGLWQQLGRAGPPLFLKVRSRSSLQEAEGQVGTGHRPAIVLYQESGMQLWTNAGVGGRQLLMVCWHALWIESYVSFFCYIVCCIHITCFLCCTYLIMQGAAAVSAAEQFWSELAGQTWRTELDYGLAKESTEAAAAEQLLVVTASQTGVNCLLQAALSQDAGSGGGHDLAVVELQGWNQGAKQQQLQTYKQLQPRLLQTTVLQ
jgi:hypothetical protein